MTGRWVSSVGLDRTRSVASGGLLEMIGRWGPASGRSDWSIQSPRVVLSEGYNGSISWGLLFKPHSWLKLTLLAICINIAAL